MKQNLLQRAEGYIKAHKNRRKWRRIVTCFSMVVALLTSSLLTLPAVTLEQDYCTLTEHEHTLACYAPVTVIKKSVPICTLEGDYVHTHDEFCYDEDGELWCQLAEKEAHQHDESCIPENQQHEHSEACYIKERGRLVCEQHEHTQECYGEVEDEENVHETEQEVAIVTQQAEVQLHQHDESCYQKTTGLICGIESEHQHDDTCYEWNEILSCKEAETNTEETTESIVEQEVPAEKEESEEQFLCGITSELLHQHSEACFEEVEIPVDQEQLNCQNTEEGHEHTELCYGIWATVCGFEEHIHDETCNVPSTLLEHKRLVENMISMIDNMETSEEIQAHLDAYEEADDIEGYEAYYQEVSVQILTVYAYYEELDLELQKQVTNSEKLLTLYELFAIQTNVTLSAAAEKPNKQNQITIVPITHTNDFIEVNLYDYGTNINEKYNSDHMWPGFQQDGGQKSISGTYSSNFGNNITADLEAGISGITQNNSNNINAVTDTGAGKANSPIQGVLQNTLSSDGYPVLKGGTSDQYKLDYLWSDNTYATQINKGKGSIDGLFQKDATTGEYYFNSRQNHAQYDAQNNQFVLYDAVITSNVIWYPFGNFLPFNDITTQCAKATDINRAYLEVIAASALQKFNQNSQQEYKNLSDVMNTWISKMDAKFSSKAWTVTDAMNEYFNGTGPGVAANKTFSFTNSDIENIYSIDFDEATNFFFGMEISMEFVQAKNGLTGNDTDQDGTPDYPEVFKFIGDDDVWVYIDGKLVLDLSGIHRHVGGTIDFQKGIVTYYNLNVETGKAESIYKTVTFAELGLVSQGETTFKDYSEHTFKMYYMERGAGSGVCSMNFNMPLVQKNTIALTKHLTTDDESVSYFGDTTFYFQILDADVNGNKTENPIITEGTQFNVLDQDGNYSRTDTVGKNGIFSLEARETAVFPAVSETYGKYYIRELFVPGTEDQYQSTFVDGQHNYGYDTAATSYRVTIGGTEYVAKDSLVHDIKDGTTLFTLENKIQTGKLGKLSIQKEVTTSNVDHDELFVFDVTLDGKPLQKDTTYQVGTEIRTVTEEGKLSLKAGETAVISNILAGTAFTVKETQASASGYTVVYTLNGETQGSDGVSGVVKTESNTNVMIRNSENSVSISIPVVKNLEKPNGKEHVYKVYLQQVTDRYGDTVSTPAYNKTLTLPAIKIESVSGVFEIGYSEKTLGTLPKTFYYKVSEIDSDDPETAYDTSSYIIEVTVTKDSDQKLQAAITKKWKDGVEYQEEKISFTNLIISYVLPETGGKGTTLYTAGGIALMIGAAWWLIYIKKVEKE